MGSAGRDFRTALLFVAPQPRPPALPARLPFLAAPLAPGIVQVALGNYNDVEVEASSGEDEAGEYFTVRFSEPAEPAGGGGHGAGQQWWPARGHSLQRALAAARKIAWLRPKDL